MEIGAIITARRTELGMTLEELGEKVGVTKSTVKKWESGFIKNMGRDKIQLLSKALNLSPITFITGEIHPLTNIEPLDSNKFYNIPLYNSVSAGFGALAVDSIIDYVPLYFDSFAEANETLCISVTGDSMFPKIEHGDIIQVRKQSSVDSGSVAVVLVDGVDGLVKKILYGDDWIELQSFNPMYPPLRFEGSEVQRISVVGLVRKIIKSI